MNKVVFLITCFILSNLGIAQNEIKIGNQIWLKKNLDVSYFRNGDRIPQSKNPKDWKNATINKQPSWCYFNYEEENGAIYGKLYNFYAVIDKRGLAPKGWHVPTIEEWNKLEYSLGSNPANQLKSKEYWESPNNNNNRSYFTALPGGFCRSMGYAFSKEISSCFWTSSEIKNRLYEAWFISLNYDEPVISRNTSRKGRGYSVRCIKDL